MPSLSDRLQSLGVKVGTQNLKPARPRERLDHPIDSVLAGAWWHTPHGDIFTVETKYKDDFQVGAVNIKPSAPLKIIGDWAGEPKLADLPLEKFAFIDTETSGLVGGTGTYTFLVGAGKFEGDEFRLVQFFLHDPAEEIAQLGALEQFLAPCEAVVSFNGKSFDIPLLNTRYIVNRWPSPFMEMTHLDLLHLARRLWKARLPSRTLGDLETHILGAKRSDQDVPGWMIPDLYFDYLHTGDARPLRNVFYHNEIDVVSLTALLNHMTWLVADPLNNDIEHGLDIIAVGKLYADLGFLETAIEIFRHGLSHNDVEQDEYWNALAQLSFIYKKCGELGPACSLWEEAAAHGQIYAHEELAKVFEHRERDFKTAHYWTSQAIQIANTADMLPFERQQILTALEHRLARLERKAGKD
jgi:uncharacterized protein YprB with RNaseH-like and TPR domain